MAYSRDPATPLDFTTSTPAGPQTRDRATTVTIDRVMRLRYQRRADQLAAPVIPAIAYNTALATVGQSGWESFVGAGWNTTEPNYLYQNFVPAQSGDWMCGFCFPATGSANGAVCSLAELTLVQTNGAPFGPCRVRAESNAVGASSLYSGTNWISDHLFTNMVAAVSASFTFTGPAESHTFDVTALVNQVMAGAAYAGGYINFILDTDDGGGCFIDMAGAATVTPANRPTLVITP